MADDFVIVTVIADNTLGSLTQEFWASLYEALQSCFIGSVPSEDHQYFTGGTAINSKEQKYVFIYEMTMEELESLKRNLSNVRIIFFDVPITLVVGQKVTL